jgi:hypothetical protein
MERRMNCRDCDANTLESRRVPLHGEPLVPWIHLGDEHTGKRAASVKLGENDAAMTHRRAWMPHGSPRRRKRTRGTVKEAEFNQGNKFERNSVIDRFRLETHQGLQWRRLGMTRPSQTWQWIGRID